MNAWIRRALGIALLVGMSTAAVFSSGADVAIASPMAPPPQDSVAGMLAWRQAREGLSLKVPGWFEAYLDWYRQRAYPYDRIDWPALRRAEAQRDQSPAARLASRRINGKLAAPFWESLGPNTFTPPRTQFNGPGPNAARVNHMAISPADSEYWWAAVAQGGVWRKPSGGQWQCVSNGWTNQRVNSVAIDPGDDRIVYVGTGDFDKGPSAYGYGIMRTRDRGQTWTNVGAAEMGGKSVRRIVICPEDPQVVLATTGRGPNFFVGELWRSADGGDSWTQVITFPGDFTDLAFSAPFPGNGERFYYACANGNAGGGVWRSGDRGVSWTKLVPPFSSDAGGLVKQDMLDVACSPITPELVYVLSGTDRQVYRSSDSGTDGSWTTVTSDLSQADATWSQFTYDMHIECTYNPDNNVDVLIVGLIDLFASFNGGGQWVSIGQTTTTGAQTHNDQHSVTVSPGDPLSMLVGNDGGAHLLSISPSAGSWSFTPVNSGFVTAEFYHAGYSATDPAVMIGGSQDNGSPHATGNLADWVSHGGGDGAFGIVDPTDKLRQFTNVYGTGDPPNRQLNLYRTVDGWTTPVSVAIPAGSDTIGFINPLALDPLNVRRVYMASNFLYRYDSDANQYTPRFEGQALANGTNFVKAIAVSTDGSRIYTGSSDAIVAMRASATWSFLGGTKPNRAVTSIAVDPAEPTDILVSYSGTGTSHIFRCANTVAGAVVFADVGGVGAGIPDAPVNWVTRDPADPDRTWYAGSDVGIFMTTNAGASWANLGTPYGLPNIQVNQVEVVPGTGYLMAATFGRGIWRIRVADGGGIGDDFEPDGTREKANLLPDGATQEHSLHAPADQDWVRFDLPDTRTITLRAQSNSGPGKMRLELFRFDPGSGNLIPLEAVDEDVAGVARIRRAGSAATYFAVVKEIGQDEIVTSYSLGLQTAAGDELEPDNSREGANLLPDDGSLQRHTFHAGDPVDWVRVPVAVTATILLETAELGADVRVRIRVENEAGDQVFTGQRIVEADGTVKEVYHFDNPGTYYIAFTSFDGDTSGDQRYAVRMTRPQPQAPTGLATVMQGNAVKLTWNDVDLADGLYELFRRATGDPTFYLRLQTSGQSTTGPMEFLDSEVTSGVTYTYFVRNTNNNGSVQTSEVSITTPGTPQPPRAPSNVRAFPMGADRLIVTWIDESTDESRFTPELSTDKRRWSGRPIVPGASGTGSTLFSIITGLKAATTYYIRVRADGPGGSSSPIPSKGVKVITLKKGANPLGIAASVTITTALNTPKSSSIRISNPLSQALRFNVPAPTGMFTAAPTGSVNVPAGGSQTITLTLTPTARTVPAQTLTITSEQPAGITARVKLIGKVKP